LPIVKAFGDKILREFKSLVTNLTGHNVLLVLLDYGTLEQRARIEKEVESNFEDYIERKIPLEVVKATFAAAPRVSSRLTSLVTKDPNMVVKLASTPGQTALLWSLLNNEVCEEETNVLKMIISTRKRDLLQTRHGHIFLQDLQRRKML
jgi:hypothetical protein